MSGTVHFRGGWNNSTLDTASPSMRARIRAADAEYEREAAREQREREQRAAENHERAIHASIQQALERGEIFDMRHARQHGVGRTHAEIIEYASAMQDVEDMREAARRRKAFEAFEQRFYGDNTADTSAPTEAEVAEAELIASRAEERRTKRRETSRLLGHAVKLARWDREAGR
jgi:hypothetical protein